MVVGGWSRSQLPSTKFKKTSACEDPEEDPAGARIARKVGHFFSYPSQAAKTAKAAAKSTARTHVKSSGMRVRPRATMAKPTSMANKMKMRGGGTTGRASAASKAKVRPSAGKAAGTAANRAATRTAAPRGGGRVNVRRIAKASDRASTGLDLVEAASSEDAITGGNNKSDIGGRLKDVMRRVPAFMATLAKNTVLGMAVFATYESVVECELPSSSSSYSSPAETKDDIVSSDSFAAASLSRHVTAGFLAGTAHAGVNYTMDALVRMRHTIWGSAVKGTALAAPAPFLPYTMHHSISHGILFGSYEGTKRMLVPFLAGGVGGENNHHRDIHDDDENAHYGNILAIGLAGGIAGTLQHVASEYTETALVTSYSKIWQANDLTFSERLHLLPRASMPSARALAMAFVPSSIGFVAFEYGKEFLTDSDD